MQPSTCNPSKLLTVLCCKTWCFQSAVLFYYVHDELGQQCEVSRTQKDQRHWNKRWEVWKQQSNVIENKMWNASSKRNWDSWAWKEFRNGIFFFHRIKRRGRAIKGRMGNLWGADCDTVQAVTDQSKKKGEFCKILRSKGWKDRQRGRGDGKQRTEISGRANPGDSRVACQWKCIMGIILWLCVLA